MNKIINNNLKINLYYKLNMNSLYNINGCKHFMHDNQTFLKDPNFYPEFQTLLLRVSKQKCYVL